MKQYFIKSKYGNINIIEGKDIDVINGILLHIHGLGAHFQSDYAELDDFETRDNFFIKNNLKSFAFEFTGHGKSEGKKSFISNIDDLLIDLDNVIKHIKKNYNHKIFICAESMGAAIVIKYLSILNINVDGIILLSPLCGLDKDILPPKIVTNFILFMSHYFPNIKLCFKKIEVQYENLKYMEAKKLCKYLYRDNYPLTTLREIYNISSWIMNNEIHIDIPLLLIHGLDDKITSPIASYNFFNKLNNDKKEILLIPNVDHCTLIPSKVDTLVPHYIYIKILNWINKHL